MRFDTPEGKIELPVKLRVHDSIFVPLAKWSMLLAGNYRCITQDGMRTAKKRCIRTSRNRARSIISCSTYASSSAPARATWCRSKNTPPRRKACRVRPRLRARCSTVRPISSAPTSWCSHCQAEGPEPSGNRRQCRISGRTAGGESEKGRRLIVCRLATQRAQKTPADAAEIPAGVRVFIILVFIRDLGRRRESSSQAGRNSGLSTVRNGRLRLDLVKKYEFRGSNCDIAATLQTFRTPEA